MSLIPVANVFHLLTYAWAALRDPDEAADAADLTVDTTLPHLLAAELARTVERLLRRGLLHQYTAQPPEEMPRLRGKLLVAQTLRTHALTRGRAWCQPDEFVPDTLSNRLIRSTLHYLLHTDALTNIDPEATAALRHRLAVLLPRLPPRPLLKVSAAGAQVFRRIRPSRATALYRIPLRLCRLIWELSQTTKAGDFEADPWLRALLDEARKRKLYEKFVRNFCRHHYPGYQTGARKPKWGLVGQDDLSLQRIPSMETDVLVTSRADQLPHLLIECKYTPKFFAKGAHGPSQKLRTEHLYQLHAYYTHLARPLAASFRALLLYPALGPNDQHRLSYAVGDSGHHFHVATLNLNQPWADVETELHGLLGLK